MPATAPTLKSAASAERIEELFAMAANFVAMDRTEALMRKWLPRQPADRDPASDPRLLGMMADAVLLSMELMVGQPSFTGSTAFDRLGRSLGRVTPEDAAAIEALRSSRFRLFHAVGATPDEAVIVKDVMSGETLTIEADDLPEAALQVPLFARFVPLGDACHGCLPGVVTPLDDYALRVARDHKAAGGRNAASNARWAEALFTHVVQYGTLEIPGLNRPRDEDDGFDRLDELDPAVANLAVEWAALGGEAPDADLLQQTREHVALTSIIDALTGAILLRDRDPDLQAALERILAIQLDVVSRRERGGATTLTLDMIAQALDEAIARRNWPPEIRVLFDRLRPRPGVNAGQGGAKSGTTSADPALDRLVQRIQGLRAKTVAQGCTEQEAMAAAEKVAELLDRYGLSLSELELQAQPCEGIGIQTDRRRLAAIDECIPMIALFFDCRVWAERGQDGRYRYIFFGLRGDVTAAQYLYELVERAFETETALFRKSDLYRDMAGDRRRATSSFQIGLSRGISTKLHDLRAARDATIRSASGRDLVPVKAAMVDDELEKLGLNLTRRALGRRKSVLTDAYAAGHEAGERFEVAHGITEEQYRR